MQSSLTRIGVGRFAAALTCIGAHHLSRTNKDETVNCSSNDTPPPRLVFLGSGSSTGCPRPLCPMMFGTENNHKKEYMAPFCKVSNIAVQADEDPRNNKNYRNNPSLLISSGGKNIIIDVGKTFREGALRWFPGKGISSLDAIVLTHHHMDAAGGLDDVRGFQSWEFLPDGQRRAIPMPLFLSANCLKDVSKRFPWLHIEEHKIDKNKLVQRHVASFDTQVFESFKPFDAAGLQVIPLPVMHGEDLVSYGFAFTVGTINVVYISDVSRCLPETLEFIKTKLPPTTILIVDALLPDNPHPVHFSLKQAVELTRIIKPKQCYLVGMNCDAFSPHDQVNADLKKKYGNIQFAHDGLVVDAS
jgi:phosphoribosyl 1,2-cyclic phosphodiesterase